jgi:hypothetical protein
MRQRTLSTSSALLQKSLDANTHAGEEGRNAQGSRKVDGEEGRKEDNEEGCEEGRTTAQGRLNHVAAPVPAQAPA